jgi:teichuronic acid biosynthesis glycosyltransferase TuaC
VSAAIATSAFPSPVFPKVQKKPSGLRVLTLTPFFPSAQDPAQGCFIAEPIPFFQELGVVNHVIAVEAFYRSAREVFDQDSEWQKYYCVPGNLGLATSGVFLARGLKARVRELHRSSPIDLIHAHAALPCGQAAMFLSKELRVPFVVSVHGLDVFSDKQAGPLLGRWTKRASLQVYRQANAVVAISQRVQQQFQDGLQSKISVVYNGVDSKLFVPRETSKSEITVLSVGNFIAIKEHACLLRAFARCSAGRPHLKLELIGDGPERANLVALARALGISSRVVFRGRQNREAVASAMQSCTVFALPSRYEGLGCVYLEAMACGKTAIGCFGQGIEEIIRNGENGFLVAPGDESALAKALAAVLNNESLGRRIGMAARQTIVHGYTLQHQARKLAALYQGCLV